MSNLAITHKPFRQTYSQTGGIKSCVVIAWLTESVHDWGLGMVNGIACVLNILKAIVGVKFN